MQNSGSDGSGNELGAGEKQLADQNFSVSSGRFQKEKPVQFKKYFQTAAVFFGRSDSCYSRRARLLFAQRDFFCSSHERR